MNQDESISTLRFACTAKRIKNKAKINEDAKDALLRKFQDQISELRRQLEEAASEANEDKMDANVLPSNESGKEGQFDIL
jgi:uncharacterized membrane protein YukC